MEVVCKVDSQAMMSDTYTNIIVNARKEHVFPFARTVLFMEKVRRASGLRARRAAVSRQPR